MKLLSLTLLATFSGFCLGYVACLYTSQTPQQDKIVNVKSHFELDENNLPICSYTLSRDGYTVSYDPRTKNPRWVYEEISDDNLNGDVDRASFYFKEDVEIPRILRSNLNDYRNSGFDRGHLAAAANHKNTQQSMQSTFLLTNISPQAAKLNRGLWANVEKYTRNLCKSYGKVKVYSGPLFIPEKNEAGERWVKYQVIGENSVAVPTHFYKVIVIRKNGSNDAQAYIIPNKSLGDESSLESYKTTVKKVSQIAGIIFPGIEED